MCKLIVMMLSLFKAIGISAILWLLTFGHTYGQALQYGKVSLQHIAVRDQTGSGVCVEVLRVDSDNNQHSLSHTDTTGQLVFDPPRILSEFEKLIVEPLESTYYTPPPRRVQNKVQFVLQPKKWHKAEQVQHVRRLLDQNDAISRTCGFVNQLPLINAEIAQRVRDVDPELEIYSRNKAYLTAAKHLGVDQPVSFDHIREIHVPSEDLVQAIREYQRRVQVPVTGRLDIVTMIKMAGKSLWSYLFGDNPTYDRSPKRPSVEFDELPNALVNFGDKILVTLGAGVTNAAKRGNHARAAFLCNEIMVRLRNIDSEQAHILANAMEVEVYEASGRALGVPEALMYDRVQGMFVMTTSLAGAIREFQSEANIAETARLDSLTLSAMAEIELWVFLYGAVPSNGRPPKLQSINVGKLRNALTVFKDSELANIGRNVEVASEEGNGIIYESAET